MPYLFTSESVSEGHPDKVADQISDALLDQFLAYDDKAHCAIETFVTTGQVVIMGEVHSEAYIDLQTIARRTINKIGYTKSEYQFDGNSCGILTAIHEQSGDINQGVQRATPAEQGAGDQGMMFGYATAETENYMPVSLYLSHLLVKTLADIRKEGKEMTYLRPDSKSQVTVEYGDDNVPRRIDTIVVSTQHDEFIDDEVVYASTKTNDSHIKTVSSFDFSKLRDYDPQFIAGFAAERYSLGLDDGWNVAQSQIRAKLEQHIRENVRARYKADRVKDVKLATSYDKITFKYLLAPIWISNFKFNGTIYNFVVNGQTGRIAGKSPVSALRVAIAIIIAIVVLGIAFYVFNQ